METDCFVLEEKAYSFDPSLPTLALYTFFSPLELLKRTVLSTALKYTAPPMHVWMGGS